MSKDNPIFQHRHYAEIASVLSSLDNSIAREAFVDRLAKMFHADNERFDDARFRAAAYGVPSNRKDRR